MFNYPNYGRLWKVYGLSVPRYGSPKKILNAIRTEIAYRRHTEDVKSHPYVLFVEPVYTCNLACPLCARQTFDQTRQGDTSRLSMDLYDRLLDEIGDYLFQCHIFGLGEPLLDWPVTRQVIEKAHRRRIFTLLSTNSTALTQTVAEEIVASGLDYLVCAIDGVSQEAYGAYRIGGKVARALKGLRTVAAEKKLRRSGMAIEWQFLVNAHNEHEVPEARRIARELGVYLRLAPMRGSEFDEASREYWSPKGPEWRGHRLPPGEPFYDFSCYWLWRAVVLNSNGQMARCPGYQNVAEIGSLHDHTVRDIYNGPGSRRSRRLFDKGPVPDGPFPTPCSTCPFYKRHHGGPYEDMHKSAGVPYPTNGTIPIASLERHNEEPIRAE